MSLMNPKKVQGTGVGLELPMAVLVTLLVFHFNSVYVHAAHRLEMTRAIFLPCLGKL